MKLGGRVHNMCLVLFVVETYGYDFPRTNQGPLRRTLAFWCKGLPGQCAPTRGIDGRRLVDGASMPSINQHLA